MGPSLAVQPDAMRREDFPAFPGQPYPIQVDFMRALYRSLSSGGVGLFESPTGASNGVSKFRPIEWHW